MVEIDSDYIVYSLSFSCSQRLLVDSNSMLIKTIITCERDKRIRFALDANLIRIKCTCERSITNSFRHVLKHVISISFLSDVGFRRR